MDGNEREAVSDPEGRYWLDDFALPRSNGELVFAEPWEGRVFSLALALRSRRPYAWTTFGEKLAAALRDDSQNYYEAWLRAFESLLIDGGLISEDELHFRASEYRRGIRSPGL
jgi:nitrile hydratase accessory protein